MLVPDSAYCYAVSPSTWLPTPLMTAAVTASILPKIQVPDGRMRGEREAETFRRARAMFRDGWAWQTLNGFVIRPFTLSFALFPGSSVVEQPAVNRLVDGSNPSRGAIFLHLKPSHRPLGRRWRRSLQEPFDDDPFEINIRDLS